MMHAGDYVAQAELAPVLLGELHGAYVHLPQQRAEVLVGLMEAYQSVMWTTRRLGARGLPALAAGAVQHCAGTLGEPVWLGYAAYIRGAATGHLNRAVHYHHSVAAAEALTGRLDSSETLLACGLLHLSAALAAGGLADQDVAATHLAEASALAARMDAEVGSVWGGLEFGRAPVGVWRTEIALGFGEYGQVLDAAATAHPEVLTSPSEQAGFWSDVGRALAVERKTRDKAVRVFLHAEQLSPQRLRSNVFVREVVADLVRQERRDTGGRELRRLAHRMGIPLVR